MSTYQQWLFRTGKNDTFRFRIGGKRYKILAVTARMAVYKSSAGKTYISRKDATVIVDYR